MTSRADGAKTPDGRTENDCASGPTPIPPTSRRQKAIALGARPRSPASKGETPMAMRLYEHQATFSSDLGR